MKFSVKGFMNGKPMSPRTISAKGHKEAAETYTRRRVRLLKTVTSNLHVYLAPGFNGIFTEIVDKPHQMRNPSRKKRDNPRTRETGIRQYGPGKFHTLLDLYIYHIETDDDLGDVQDFGWYGIIRDLELSEVEAVARDEFKDTLTAAEKELIRDTAGAIVSEDSQGFYSVELFEDSDALEADWENLEAEADKFYEENEGY
ncbi:MAG: hypothetical protein GY950_00840 [bacterium]|nr:hypothetical protein [bacterium]